ncbi:MAG TPA: DUF2264 domain-containing protein, partial [Chitinophagaceae bacterium]|nr:DUF2264 domain-containing protein [Chitinophagaceae bacterium]
MQQFRRGFYVLLFMLTAGLSQMQAQQSANKQVKQSSLPDDRSYWVNTLYKIAYPVIHHLAEGTLSKSMPLEQGPNYNLQVKKVSYLEAVGRTMAGVAPWLALPDDDSREGRMRKQMRSELLKGLANAVDPASPDCLNFATENQPIVDAAYVA